MDEVFNGKLLIGMDIKKVFMMNINRRNVCISVQVYNNHSSFKNTFEYIVVSELMVTLSKEILKSIDEKIKSQYITDRDIL